jgi:phosphate transport system substrate-binding protein
MLIKIIYIVLICTISIISICLPPQRASASDANFTEVPFDYTTEVIPKSDQWKDQPISYDKWAKGADLAVTLDQHLYQIMLPLIKDYAKQNKLDIAVKEGTCGISSGLMSKKAVDIAGFCCPPGRIDRLPGIEFHTIGIAPLAIIVNKDNPINDLTDAQVRMIFSGKVENWSKITSPDSTKGAGLPISPITRLHCKARPGHWRLILDNEDEFGYNIQDVGTIPDMVRSVASYAGAIGHLATWNTHKYRDKWPVKALKINSVSPEDKNALMEGRYPYYRAYSITSWNNNGKENPLVKELIKYLMDSTDKLDKNFSMVPADELREKGWKFNGDELIGATN